MRARRTDVLDEDVGDGVRAFGGRDVDRRDRAAPRCTELIGREQQDPHPWRRDQPVPAALERELHTALCLPARRLDRAGLDRGGRAGRDRTCVADECSHGDDHERRQRDHRPAATDPSPFAIDLRVAIDPFDRSIGHHLDLITLQESLLDRRGGWEGSTRRVRLAEREQPARCRRITVDPSRRLPHPLAETHDAHEAEPRRIGDRRPVPAAVLGDPPPQRHLPDGGAGDPAEARELLGLGRRVYAA